MSRADDYLLTAEELRLRRTKRRRSFVGALVFVLFLILVIFGARPTSHAIKGWQARRHADKALQFIAEEKWSDAGNEARAGYQLWPSEPEAVRAVARFLSRMRQAQALEFWEQLAKQQPLTRDDQRDRATVALAFGESPVAEVAVKQLLGRQEGGPAPADWLLAVQLAVQKNAGDQATGDLEKVLGDHAATERQLVQASLLQIAIAGNAATPAAQQAQTAGWTRLTNIAQGKSAVALDALTILAQRALSSPNESPGGTTGAGPELVEWVSSPSLAQALELHPLSQAPQKLLAVDLRIHAEPARREELINGAIEEWKQADNNALGALAKWLNGKGEFQRELETVPLERALQTRDLFLQHVDALGALGHWEEIRRLLESERFPLEPTIQNMYLARCYAQLGQNTASENNWRRAVETAAGDVGKLMTLAEYAEKNGATVIASNAYDGALGLVPHLRAAWQGKLRLAQAARETKKIHGVLTEMLKFWPNDSAVQNDEAYTRLLLLPNDPALISQPPISDELASIETLAEKLLRREPASLPHRTLLALSRLKQRRPIAALDVYANIQLAPNALTPSALAVHAAVLAANNQRADARHEIEQIPVDRLLPEEQAGTSDLRQ